ncbi:HisM ABC-type amino acid transport system, permease component [Burkholderiaceae bacterium]
MTNGSTYSSRIQTRRRRTEVVLLLVALAIFIFIVKDYRWSVVVDAAPLLAQGLAFSWFLTIASVLIGLPMGIVLAILRTQKIKPIRIAAVAIVEIIRATPQLMVIFWVYFALPSLTGVRIPSWPAAVFSLSIIAAAYLAEVVRGGLNAVPHILIESGYATGLSRFQILRHIVIPQALRTMIPSLISHIVMMFKLTSLIYIVGITDFFRAVILINNRVFEPLPLYTMLAIGYFVCCYALSRLVRRFDVEAARAV